MEPSAFDALTPARQRQLLALAGFREEEVLKLGGFENFVFATSDQVIRITHCSHRSADQLLGELEFMEYLARHGCAVSQPCRFRDGQLLLVDADFCISLFVRAKGARFDFESAYAEVVESWGQAIGRFHHIAAGYQATHVRGDWRADENHNFARRIPAHQTKVLALATAHLQSLSELPVSPQTYGLIHGDAHPGNFLVAGDRLTFFDFDDAIYTWFGYDVATILISVVLQAGGGADQEAQRLAVSRFLPIFLKGYAREHPVSALLLAEMPKFLKLREFSLYAVIHAQLDLDHLAELPFRFMHDRQARIERSDPFIDLDFSKLSP